MSDSLWLHGLQHARPPCPSKSPGARSNSCPSSWWCHPTISSSVAPFSCSQGTTKLLNFFYSCCNILHSHKKCTCSNFSTTLLLLLLLLNPAAAAKLLQLCLTVRPHRWQPTVPTVPGILQARILEWVAISFSNAWKWKVKVKLLSGITIKS